MNLSAVITLCIALNSVIALQPQKVSTVSWFSKLLSSKPKTQLIPVAAAGLTDEDRNDVNLLIRNLTWGGFDTRAEIRQTAEEALPHDTWTKDDLAWLDREIDSALESKQRAQQSWSGPTAFEKLDAVFAALKRKGILALHRTGNTQSDGWDDARQFRDEAGGAGSGFDGAIFYHGQDVDRGLEDKVLLLTFGAFPGSERTALEIANETVAALTAAGFDAVAPADDTQRIEIKSITWTKRSP